MSSGATKSLSVAGIACPRQAVTADYDRLDDNYGNQSQRWQTPVSALDRALDCGPTPTGPAAAKLRADGRNLGHGSAMPARPNGLGALLHAAHKTFHETLQFTVEGHFRHITVTCVWSAQHAAAGAAYDLCKLHHHHAWSHSLLRHTFLRLSKP